MNRRTLLKNIALITGASVVGAEFFLSGCKRTEPGASPIGLFNGAEVDTLDAIAEAILPRTGSPGAKDAQTGAFMADFVTACYDPAEQGVVKKGITAIQTASQTAFKKSFTALAPAQQAEVLTPIAAEAKAYNENPPEDAPPHYFTLFQQLTMLGFFTSEPGATQVLRYNPVPGKYRGCIEYKKGEKAWM